MSKAIDKAADLEIRISLFLRYGVILAGLLIFVGWVLHLDVFANPFATFSVYHAEPLAEVVAKAFEEKSLTLLFSYAGLFCLISLPIIRVLLTAILFVREKQYAMAAMASFVFVALMLSFALGFHIG
ncbi:MAG: hypothetical protein ABS42_00255 [Bdellovibrio sp. SCN 50-8]|nr:MAG: hypothetical protein ABS42_00255 [Bdellovibrio sp. SCN 50-8]